MTVKLDYTPTYKLTSNATTAQEFANELGNWARDAEAVEWLGHKVARTQRDKSLYEARAKAFREVGDMCHSIGFPNASHVLRLSSAEVQSGHNRVARAEGLIEQLPPSHEGALSWLLNFGTRDRAQKLRASREVEFVEATQSAATVEGKGQ